MINIMNESESRYDVKCYSKEGNLIYSKQFFNDKDKAIRTCKRWKNKYHYVNVEDNVIGCEYYNPYGK